MPLRIQETLKIFLIKCQHPLTLRGKPDNIIYKVIELILCPTNDPRRKGGSPGRMERLWEKSMYMTRGFRH